MTTNIDTSPAALRKMADQLESTEPGGELSVILCVFYVIKVLRSLAAEKEAQAKQEPFAWASYGLMPNGITGWRFATHKSTFWNDKSQQPLYLAPQHHKEQPLEMPAPADVPLPEYTIHGPYGTGTYFSGHTDAALLAHREAYANAKVAAERERNAGWFALVAGAAAAIEDAANCLRDPDAKKAAEGSAKHYRAAANAMWKGTA